MVLVEAQRAMHDPCFVLARLYRRAVRSKHKFIVCKHGTNWTFIADAGTLFKAAPRSTKIVRLPV